MKSLLVSITVVLILAAGAGALAVRHFSKPEKPAPVVLAEDVKVTLIEGWTLADIARNMERQKLATADDFLAAAKDVDTGSYPTVSSSLPASGSLEGYVFPDTYRIPKPEALTATSSRAASIALLKKALQNFETKFTAPMREKARARGLSIHEAITLASIIERETGRNADTREERTALEAERAMVAGIFYNRLRIDMPLQSDATVNYVTGKNTPAASYEDLEVDSPYNTYRYKGLPPGPICNPSLSSIMAVLSPTESDYLYFLHKQPSGKVIYSKTFEEHVRQKNSP